MGPEYSCAFKPELARNWSAVSHRRFSSVTVAESFSEGAIQCMVVCGLWSVKVLDPRLVIFSAFYGATLPRQCFVTEEAVNIRLCWPAKALLNQKPLHIVRVQQTLTPSRHQSAHPFRHPDTRHHPGRESEKIRLDPIAEDHPVFRHQRA